MTMVYNPSTDLYGDPPGVTIRTSATLAQLCDTDASILAEYSCICTLLEDLGYTREVDLVSISYDWRKSPSDWMKPGGYFSQLKAGIENLRKTSGKTVIPVSFSLGGPVLAVFLNRYVTSAWKDANIANWVSYSGTFGGVQESLYQQLTYNGAYTISSE